ncbi:MAG: hypothetical protein Q8O09_00450, partial [Bacillota bacterium]|nr:hypothetical protein [Bacillota bacterium]
QSVSLSITALQPLQRPTPFIINLRSEATYLFGVGAWEEGRSPFPKYPSNVSIMQFRDEKKRPAGRAQHRQGKTGGGWEGTARGAMPLSLYFRKVYFFPVIFSKFFAIALATGLE